MPTQTRSRGKPSATTTYRSTAAAPKQQEFPRRRRSVKTYGRRKSGREMNQGTLTQMDFTSSAMHDFINLSDNNDEKKDETEYEDDKENVEFEPPKPVEKSKPKTKSQSNRRKTAGDELDFEEEPRRSKRRKTLGDSPNLSVSGSFHTQTLTQMMSTNNMESWHIEDFEEDGDSKLVVRTPKKGSARHAKTEPQEGTESAVPSLIESATPANRQKKTEIPSSQSPATPMLLRYSPQHSPLITKSTNVTASSPILKNPRKTPRHAVIPDSYSTAHESSPVLSQKSTVKATPSKRLRFALPDDKENITPGRTKPKSPKPKSQTPGRRPLQEVPDSDDDLDETEYETTDDEFGSNNPESPTPKRFQNIVPPVQNLELEPESELELDPSQTAHSPEEATEPAILRETQLINHTVSVEPFETVSVPKQRPVTSHNLRSGKRDLSVERAKVVTESGPLNQELDLEHSTDGEAGAEAEAPESPMKQEVTNFAPVSRLERTPEPVPSEQAENDDTADDISPSQDYLYTQGAESQRLPLDSIRALGPQTPHSDIMVSLHPEHIGRIVDRSKDHEFRVWKIPQQVSRVWIYITRPESELRYMCLFGDPKTPGEIQNTKGIGNAEFDQGRMAAKFAYEILQVYELNNPVSLDEMKRKGWVAGAPQKYTYIPPAVVGELTSNLRCALFEEPSRSENIQDKRISESQELKAQLQSDADYSTQHYSETIEEVIPASQSPRKDNVNPEALADRQDFVRPALTRVRSRSSNHGSPSLPGRKQRHSVRASQATTVSQVSSSPVISPTKSRPRPITLSSQSGGSSPTLFRRTQSSLRSSQFPTPSQMLPDSLLNADIREPPTIVWDSADDED